MTRDEIIHEHDPGPPCAYLFGNGNALFFDEVGEQITAFQTYGLSGVHLFRDRFPEAPVFWAIWGQDPADSAASEVHENVYEYITEPDIEVED